MGSIHKRGNIYHIAYRIRGRQYWESSRSTARAAAEALLSERMTGRESSRIRKQCSHPGVYFLQSATTGLVKIGCSGNIPERIATLRRGSADKLAIVGTILTKDFLRMEGAFHKIFSAKRSHGEWFALSEADLEAIVVLCV